MAVYLYLSLFDYIKTSYVRLLFVGIAVFVASISFALQTTNTNALLYGIFITVVVISILSFPVRFLSKENTLFKSPHFKIVVFTLLLFSFIASMYWFFLRFPKIVPYHVGVRRATRYFASLPGRKCLWALDMPLETALFYSNAGEILILNKGSTFDTFCKHYAIVHEEYPGEHKDLLEGKKEIYRRESIILYEL